MTVEQPMPSMKTINGRTYIKVKDLADAWHTSTSSILSTGKPNQVPAKYRRTIEGHTWCDVEGLRYRLNMMKRGGKIHVQLHQLLDRFPINATRVGVLGPQVETIHRKDGSTTTITRSFLQRIDYPSREEIQVALDNRQVVWRYKNKRIQVLAQTLSGFLDTRTSSLLAVNKKQGVPQKFIHRCWKQTWVDLEGLKERVAHTEHGSALLQGLEQVIEVLDEYETALSRPLVVEESETKQAKPRGTRENQIDVCDVAVEANKRAVHNTERLNKLDTEVKTVRGKVDGWFPSFFDRFDRLETSMYGRPVTEGIDPDYLLKNELGFIKKRLDTVEKQATQATVDQTLLRELHTRLGRVATQADSLDTRTDGLGSRVSVLEDTNKWLSWSVATVVGLRFLGLTLRWLKRK